MSESPSGLHTALLAVQAEAPTLPKNATNPHFKSKYTPLDTVVETMTPILGRHGLTWMALPSTNDAGPTLKYQLTHAPSGQAVLGEMPLLLSKNDPQGQGSAITYARRYALCAVLNIVADEDVDGNMTASPARKSPPKPALPTSKTTADLKTLTEVQAKKLEDKLASQDVKKVQLALNAIGAADLTDLTISQANDLAKQFA